MLSTNIVAELAAAMPHRTKEAIKSRRQKPEYRILVESYMVTSGVDGRGMVTYGANRPPITPGDDGRGIVPSGASRLPIDGSETGAENWQGPVREAIISLLFVGLHLSRDPPACYPRQSDRPRVHADPDRLRPTGGCCPQSRKAVG